MRIDIAPRRVVLVTALLVLSACLDACRRQTPVPPASDVRWVPIASTAGAFRLDVTGAPDRDGPFVYLLKVPANLVVPTHAHSGSLTARVREGHQIITIVHADGRRELHELRPGQSYTIPANALHEERFPMASVIELRGVGPLRTLRP